MDISKETLALVNTFKSPILSALKDMKDEVKFYFDDGIIHYVEAIKEKFSRTKTFLFRLETVDFYDVFFPVSIKHPANKRYKIENIEDLFKNSNYISIIGNAGSGKSMLIKDIFLKSILQIVKIPIVVDLRNLNDTNDTFFDYLNKLITGKKLAPNKNILERILSNGEFLFLLDGYDEIYSENKTKITTEIIGFVDDYSNNYFIITSRPGAGVESLPRFENYLVNPLTISEVNAFVKLQLKQCEDEKLADKIIEVIQKPENKDYNSYLTSPLLLSMFIMTFNAYPELPKSKSKFYWNVYDTLCTKHDSFTKQGGFQHERKTGLQNEDFENILKWFSYSSLFRGKYNFDEQYFTEILRKIKQKLELKCNINDLKYDLTVSISIILIDGLELRFPHKSLQEYFTALLIKEQDDETKSEIYLQKFNNLGRHTIDNNNNFWNLCNEIDYIPFNRFFILKNLLTFKEFIDFTSDESICLTFFKWSRFKQGFSMDTNSNEYVFNSYEWLGDVTLSIFEFLKILYLRDISLNNKIVQQQVQYLDRLMKYNLISVKEDEKKLEYSINYADNWCDEMYSFISSMGLKTIIIKSVNEVNLTIDRLGTELFLLEKNKKALLEL